MEESVKAVREALERYRAHFGKVYPLLITGCEFETDEDLIQDIETRIRKNKPKPEPTYGDGKVYSCSVAKPSKRGKR